MKKILLISPYWKEPHRWMVSSVNLAALWQKIGYKVVVVCMGSKSGEERVSDTLTIYRRKDWFLPDPLNFGIALGFTGLVRRVIRKEKPDLIVCNKVLFWSSFSLIPLRLCGHKIILLTDALVGMTWWPRQLIPKIIMAIGAWTVGWLVLLSAKRFVIYHPQSPRLLRMLGIGGKTEVIPSGVDTSNFSLLTSGTERQKLEGRSEKEITVTYIGRLESVKGVDDFLAAVVPLKRDHSDLRVKVVGWHKDKHPLVAQYQGDVEFTGLRDDIPTILGSTDIFVLPSYSEGLSNALMEAMASGCACIASDVGGNRFLIQNGVSGFLFPPGDREALRAHIRRLIEDTAKQGTLGVAARKRIEEQFSWEVVGKQWKNLFDA